MSRIGISRTILSTYLMALPTHLIVLTTLFILLVPTIIGVKLGIRWWTKKVEERIRQRRQTIPEFIQPVPRSLPTEHIILDIRPPTLTSVITLSPGQLEGVDITPSTSSIQITKTDSDGPIPDDASIGQEV